MVSAGRVAGRVIVVTGAARGQGAAEVDALVAEGASVIAADLEAPASRWTWPTRRAGRRWPSWRASGSGASTG